MMIPGRTLHRLAAQLCSAKALERVVEPAIADLQKEYAAASTLRRRVCVLLTGYGAILKVIAICAVTVSMLNVERWTLIEALVWSVATFAIVTAVLILLPFYGFDDRITGWYAAATLAPQAIPLAIPISVAFGLALGVRSRLTVSAAKIVLICAFAACLFSFATLAWVMPASNQAFRESIVRGESEPLKGYNEMSLAELRREAADSSRKRSGSARLYDHRFHFRFSLAAATLALVGFLLVVPVTNRGLRALMALGACVAYWALIYIGEGLAVYSPVAPKLAATIPASLGAWLPNIAFAIATMLLWACVHERTASRLNV